MNQPQNEMLDTTEKTRRDLIISELILSSKLDQGLPIPSAEETEMISRSWSPILSDLPTDLLRPSYEMGMKNHSGGPFGANYICAGYVTLMNLSNKHLEEEVDRIATLSKGSESRLLLQATEQKSGPCPTDILQEMKKTLVRNPGLKNLVRREMGLSFPEGD